MCKEIQEKVLTEIENALMPVSVDYIAKRLNIGWGTAIRYSLELLADGKIKGMKTTKSWVFWIEQEAGK